MSDIESRIDKLERTINELRNELRTLRVLVRTDYPSALNKIRFITEKILGQLCKEHNISWGTAEPTLENMIGPLTAKQIIPRPIAIHVRSIQTNSSPGSHFQETPLSAAHLEIAQMALVEFLEWYYSSHPNAAVAEKPAAPAAAAPLIAAAPQPAQNQSQQKKSGGAGWLLPGCLLAFAGFTVLIIVIVLLAILIPKWTSNDNSGGGTTQGASTQNAPPSPVQIIIPTDDNSKRIAELCDTYEPHIQSYITANSYVRAINKISEYQLALMKSYPATSFNDGLIQSNVFHMSCNVPTLSEWKVSDNTFSQSQADALRALGTELLVDLQGPTKLDNVVLMSEDFESLTIRTGGTVDPKEAAGNTQQFASQFFSQLGRISASSYEDVGSFHVLLLSIDTGNPDMDIVGAAFDHAGVSYAVMSTAISANHDANAQRLDAILRAVTFSDDSALSDKIDKLKQQIAGPNDFTGMLSAARNMAILGYFRPASQELSLLITAIADHMPKPLIEGNTAEDPNYGLSITNPDPTTWELHASPDGVMNRIGLAVKDNAPTNGSQVVISVEVLNPTLAFGPRAATLMGPGTTDDERKVFLRGGAGGVISSTGGTVESDDFTTFRGMLAYEVVGTNPHFPSPAVREKIIAVTLPDASILMITLIGDPDGIASEEKLLDSILHLQSDNAIPLPGSTPPG